MPVFNNIRTKSLGNYILNKAHLGRFTPHNNYAKGFPLIFRLIYTGLHEGRNCMGLFMVFIVLATNARNPLDDKRRVHRCVVIMTQRLDFSFITQSIAEFNNAWDTAKMF
ncbi:unknown [Sutterella wadsworthensis CAG:135]|nr:unknown [Sutterella wadsworthensis CAG:135]